MEKVIIFGAGEAGKNFIINQNEYQILAVADNDLNKAGTLLENIQVILPLDIQKYSYDKIIITSMYFNPIYKQLVQKLKVESSRIEAAHKNLLKEAVYPFEDVLTKQFANRFLEIIGTLLEENKVTYFLDFGTLLGIVRDRELIAWDDDIDLTCYESERPHLEKILNDFCLKYSTDVLQWNYFSTKNNLNEVTSLVLTFESIDKKYLKFNIDFWLVSFENNMAVQTMNKCKQMHFLKFEYLSYRNMSFRVPFKYKEYLNHTYGDWQIPKKETTFADYPYAFEEN